MPNRILRGAILESDRWIGLRDNASRVAFIAAVLTADDLGNMEGTTPRLRRLWRDFGIDTDEKVDRTLQELADVDLVRVYQVDGKRYVHIPRFGQFVRHLKRANPRSPWDEPEQNQSLAEKTHCVSTSKEVRTNVERTPRAVLSHPEEKRREEKTTSAESDVSLPAADDPVLETIPLVSGSEYPITASVVATLAAAYPAVDVRQEIRKAKAWCVTNPKHRKTAAGVMRFLNGWIGRAQNSARPTVAFTDDRSWLRGAK
jgi:hypothetical protein